LGGTATDIKALGSRGRLGSVAARLVGRREDATVAGRLGIEAGVRVVGGVGRVWLVRDVAVEREVVRSRCVGLIVSGLGADGLRAVDARGLLAPVIANADRDRVIGRAESPGVEEPASPTVGTARLREEARETVAALVGKSG
jgi:hypothetical protein